MTQNGNFFLVAALISAVTGCGGGAGSVATSPDAAPVPAPGSSLAASASLVAPTLGKFSWNVEAPITVALKDPQGVAVTPITCQSADTSVVTVTADCSKTTLMRLGNQNIIVSGGAYTATLALQGVPQRLWNGQHGVASSYGAGDFSLVAISDGTAMGWGGNPFGVLGQNNDLTTNFSSLPLSVFNASGTAPLAQLYQVSAGYENAFALSEDGGVWGWGQNSNCNLAQTNCGNAVLLPVRVRNAANDNALANVVQVEAGASNQVALQDNGTVMTWGYYHGQGDTNRKNFPGLVKTPDGSAPLANIVAVSAGWAFSLALSKDGKVYAWGYDLSQGRLGAGQTYSVPRPLPNTVKKFDGTDLTNIVSISAGYNFSLAVAADGSVWGWGDNANAQLGQNNQSFSGVPYAVQIKAPSGVGLLANIAMVAAGGGHALALDTAGKVFAWGLATSGQLGDGANRPAGNQSLLPRAVVGTDGLTQLGGVISIAAGYGGSTALQSDGTVLMWGDNFRGALGRGEPTGTTFVNSPVPAPVVTNANKSPLKISSLASYPNLLRRSR